MFSHGPSDGNRPGGFSTSGTGSRQIAGCRIGPARVDCLRSAYGATGQRPIKMGGDNED